MRSPTMYEIQEGRQSKFPPDRIAFHEKAAPMDANAMSDYVKGLISFDALCRIVAWNNYLDEYFEDGMIPAPMMKNELRMCGWVL